MSEALAVYYEDRRVGLLQPDKKRRLSFEYSSEWLDDERGFPVSKSLPLSTEVYTSKAHSYFTNLLPEGPLREYICKQHGISPENDYELLKRIGGDCAGALRVLEDDTEVSFEDESYEPLESFSSMENLMSLPLMKSPDVRLSLAGAQHKLPVYLKGDDLYLPVKQAPSSHIMKFANMHYKRLAEVEFLVTSLAGSVGLRVVDLSLYPYAKDQSASISRRYDRYLDGERLRRLHQEDLCQVLGVPSVLKYEHDGGPSLVDCVDVIRKYSDDVIVDTQGFLQWIVFNVLVGNCDSHGKNLSFVYEEGKTALAPHYDLVSTIIYPSVAKTLAMSVGGEQGVHDVRKQHWSDQAKLMGMRPQILISLVDELSERVLASVESVFVGCEEVNEGFRVQLQRRIVKQCRRIQKLMV